MANASSSAGSRSQAPASAANTTNRLHPAPTPGAAGSVSGFELLAVVARVDKDCHALAALARSTAAVLDGPDADLLAVHDLLGLIERHALELAGDVRTFSDEAGQAYRNPERDLLRRRLWRGRAHGAVTMAADGGVA